jgi:hypothetical protein
VGPEDYAVATASLQATAARATEDTFDVAGADVLVSVSNVHSPRCAQLLSFAHAFEQVTGARVGPP